MTPRSEAPCRFAGWKIIFGIAFMCHCFGVHAVQVEVRHGALDALRGLDAAGVERVASAVAVQVVADVAWDDGGVNTFSFAPNQ